MLASTANKKSATNMDDAIADLARFMADQVLDSDKSPRQANLAGVPAISIRTGTHSNGLPFGTQLMGAPFEDERLLELAHQIFS